VRKGFITMINHYLEVRDSLRMLFLLVDIRREPGDFEQAVLEFARNSSIPLCVVATKSDKVSINKKQSHIKTISTALGIAKSDIICTSAQTGEGKKELLRLISTHSANRPAQSGKE
jgi:GTP-binding protein